MAAVRVSDEDCGAALRREASSRAWGWGAPYLVRIVEVRNHQIDLQVRQGDQTARVLLPLPSSGLPTPWLEFSASGTEGWVTDVRSWLNEEMDTGGLAPWNTYVDAEGISRLRVRADH